MNIAERWRAIPGYEGWYEASTLGRIRIMQRPERGKHYSYPYVLAPLPYRKGYLKMQFGECRRTHKPKRDFIHRIIYRTFHGPIPKGMTVNHKNGKKGDNRPDNLELATHQEQVTHARRVGLIAPYLRGRRLLTEDDVRAIRHAYAQGNVTYIALAKKYGVVKGTIGHILSRRQWKHV